MSGATALVTGISGFAGTHLAEHLRQQGLCVFGIRCRPVSPATETDRWQTLSVDLRDADAVGRALKAVRPDYLFHLAARTSDADSFAAPAETMAVNVLGTLNLLEAVRALEKPCRILLVGSSAVYGRVPEECQPIDEETPHRPLSPYGTSKAAQDLLGRQYWDTYGLEIVRAVPFNHTGPGQRPEAALAAFARQIADAESGRIPPTIRVGDLSSRRDLLDVRDVVRAYGLLARHGQPGEAYNVCSGQAHPMQSLLERLLALARGPAFEVRYDAARARPAAIPLQVGSNARLQAATGWAPRFSIDETLRDLLDDFRRQS
jgi:GDP-4-dehydro-6-deoxy-D-mannose reductase